nr:MAG TPA: hypothetical protein [Caudoviricetes sp.]
MTKDEIKKALECCEKYAYCKDCPCYTYCEHELHKGALALITEQEKEIKRLRTTLGQCNTELNSALESLKSQCRGIGKLRAEVKQAQIDVLNKLKEKFKGYEAWYYNGIEEGYHDLEEEIDELIKEIENDK